jgi:hypothetical protein
MTDGRLPQTRRGRVLARLLVAAGTLALIGLVIAALEADPIPPMPRISFNRSWAAVRGFVAPDAGPIPAWNRRWNISAPRGAGL